LARKFIKFEKHKKVEEEDNNKIVEESKS